MRSSYKFLLFTVLLCLATTLVFSGGLLAVGVLLVKPLMDSYAESALGWIAAGIFIILPLVLASLAAAYFFSYALMMRYARKQNAETPVISHPKRSFALAALFSLILLTWALTISSYISSSPNSNNPTNPSTPTPTPSIAPEAEEEGMIMHNTLPVPPSAGGSTSSDREVAGATTSEEVAMVRTAVSQINHALIAQDSQVLYGNMSSQLTAMFSAESVAEAFASLSSASIEMVGDPEISDQWATQRVSYTNNGAAKTYTIVLHLENGSWKFLGTINQ